MNTKVVAIAKIYPSEDTNKVISAINNVISNAVIKVDDNNAIAVADGKDALRLIQQQTKAREVLGVLKKRLLDNLLDDQTWFYINKQAAYAGVIVVCDEIQESPLGPIKIIIKSDAITDIIDWLTSKAHQ